MNLSPPPHFSGKSLAVTIQTYKLSYIWLTVLCCYQEMKFLQYVNIQEETPQEPVVDQTNKTSATSLHSLKSQVYPLNPSPIDPVTLCCPQISLFKALCDLNRNNESTKIGSWKKIYELKPLWLKFRRKHKLTIKICNLTYILLTSKPWSLWWMVHLEITYMLWPLADVVFFFYSMWPWDLDRNSRSGVILEALRPHL